MTDKEAIKAKLPMTAVVLHYGIDLEPEGDRLIGVCPFHKDSRPSLAVFVADDGLQLAGCWSCDFRPSDIFGFIMRKEDCSFPDAIKVAESILDGGELPELAVPERSYEKEFDFDEAIRKAHARPLIRLYEWLQDRGLPMTPEWVAQEFRVGVGERGEILIPHYDAATGALSALKWRTDTTKPIAYTGSRLDNLYGVWRDRGQGTVVLCEGESDTWATAWLLRDDPSALVLGLPSGAAANPHESWLSILRDRTVVLLFDADTAGRIAAARWIGALSGAASQIRVASLPDGEDAASAGSATLRAIDDALPWLDISSLPLKERNGRYERVTGTDKDTGQPAYTPMSDFLVSVERVIVMDEDAVFEVRVPGKSSVQFITARQFSNVQQMRDWCSRRLLSWKGGARETSELMEILKADALHKPRVRGTDVIGLHEGTFVLGHCAIGSNGWGYVPPVADVHFAEALRLCERQDWHRSVPRMLSELHEPDVITPIIGWIAAAPLRSLCPKFPVLGVLGGAGWGKTTLVQTILETFGFWCKQPTTLTSTTPHGVSSYAAATNAFPVWFDEYRRGARVEAKQRLDQVIRDAWDGSSAVKGGVGDEKQAVHAFPARAPIVVTGEDGFSETSHAERMVLVQMKMEGRNPDALRWLDTAPRAGFGTAYLHWLVKALDEDLLPSAPDLKSRPAQARAVAAWGYELLQQFTRETVGYELISFDESRIAREHSSAASLPPYIEALAEALNRESHDGKPVAWVDGDDICFRSQDLGRWALQRTDIVLPGGSRAMVAWFRERWRMSEERNTSGRYFRLRGAAKEPVFGV